MECGGVVPDLRLWAAKAKNNAPETATCVVRGHCVGAGNRRFCILYFIPSRSKVRETGEGVAKPPQSLSVAAFNVLVCSSNVDKNGEINNRF